MSTQVQSLRLMLDFIYSAMQAGRIVRSILNITGTFPKFFWSSL